MGKPSERIVIIETDPVTGEVDRGKVLQAVSDFIGTLFAVGGKLQIAADRVIVGQVQVGEGVQDIGETQGLVLRYQSFSPARRMEDDPLPLEDAHEELEEAPEPIPVALDLTVDPEQVADRDDRDDLMTDAEIRELVAAEQRG